MPTLNADADTNDNDLDTLTLTVDGSPATTVPIGSTTAQITLDGRFKDATRVGFFRADDPTLAPAAVERLNWVNPTGPLPYSSNNGSVSRHGAEQCRPVTGSFGTCACSKAWLSTSGRLVRRRFP